MPRAQKEDIMAFVWQDKKTRTWYLDYTPPGGKRTRKRIGKSKQAANLALKEIEYQLSFDHAGVAVPDEMLKDFFEKYTTATQPRLRPNSWKRYRAIIGHFQMFIGPQWGKVKLQQLSRELFERYVAWRRAGNGAFPEKMKNGGKTAKAKTVNTELDMLASMLNKAVDWRYLARNPAKAISRLKEDDRKPFRFFSQEEIELLRLVADLLDAGVSDDAICEAVERFHAGHRNLTLVESPSSKRRKTKEKDSEEEDEPSREDLREGRLRNLRLIVDFLLTTGARKDEALGLEWSWLDLKRGLASFRHRSNWVPKGGERDVGLKPAVVERLKKWRQESSHPRVFLDWSGKPIPKRTFERGIQRLIRHARIPRATLHDFRHTFASHLAMAGVPLPTIQQLLGHQDIQTVMIYAHLSPGHVRQSVEALPF